MPALAQISPLVGLDDQHALAAEDARALSARISSTSRGSLPSAPPSSDRPRRRLDVVEPAPPCPPPSRRPSARSRRRRRRRGRSGRGDHPPRARRPRAISGRPSIGSIATAGLMQSGSVEQGEGGGGGRGDGRVGGEDRRRARAGRRRCRGRAPARGSRRPRPARRPPGRGRGAARGCRGRRRGRWRSGGERMSPFVPLPCRSGITATPPPWAASAASISAARTSGQSPGSRATSGRAVRLGVGDAGSSGGLRVADVGGVVDVVGAEVASRSGSRRGSPLTTKIRSSRSQRLSSLRTSVSIASASAGRRPEAEVPASRLLALPNRLIGTIAAVGIRALPSARQRGGVVERRPGDRAPALGPVHERVEAGRRDPRRPRDRGPDRRRRRRARR